MSKKDTNMDNKKGTILEGDERWRERTNLQLREAQMQDLELKTIINSLENLSKVQRKKGLIGYRMEDTMLYCVNENEK